ncbi:MAG: S8 family serine peptidase, partial [Candidatus Zixiibacteriota bacterium]
MTTITTCNKRLRLAVAAMACVAALCAGLSAQDRVPGQALVKLRHGTKIESPAQERVPGQVLLKLQHGFNIEGLVGHLQGVSLDTIVESNTFLVRFPDTFPLDRILFALRQRPGVLAAHHNFLLGLPEVNQMSQSFPDESEPPYVSGESPPSYYGQAASYSIGLDSAHTVATGSGIVVAVIDNGLDFSHPLFEGRLHNNGYDFVDDDTLPAEENGELLGHGTFVSGLIALAAP